MNEWHDFFLAQAGAAGVLTGLVFVGVSINLQKIVSDPRSGLAGRAGERLRGEHLTQLGAGYERVRELQREAQAVWAGRGVLALPPEIGEEVCSPY